jgi:predicted amidohydrolase YtcJ
MTVSTSGDRAEIIFFGGPIISMEDRFQRVEALAVRGGKILALGAQDDIMSLSGPETKRVDLAGRTLMPGFIEPHTHPILSAMLYDWVDVSGFTHADGAAVLAALKEAAHRRPAGEWILAFGYDPILNRDLTALNTDLLDEITSVHPLLVLVQTMHTAYVNHQAFKAAGITEDTPQPGGGQFVKDSRGCLTGMIIEQGGILPFLMAVPPGKPSDYERLVKRQLRRYARAGYTTVCAAGLFPAFPKALETIKAEVETEDFLVRLAVMARSDDLERGMVLPPESGPDRFFQAGVKFWYDGSPYTGNMFLDEPYLENDLMQNGLGLPVSNVGQPVLPKEIMQDLVQKYHDAGRQISIHGQGDRAIRDILDVYENVLTATPRQDHRHRIEHGALFPLEEIERAVRLGLTVSWHINHIHYYGEALRDEIVGPQRVERLMPLASAIENGLKGNSLHNDSPMYPAEPLKLVKTAVSRKTRRGAVIAAGQAVTIQEALKAVTINAAWQVFMEDRIGSLAPGKWADLVILSDNPLRVSPDDLDSIGIVETWLSGERRTWNDSWNHALTSE